jgi:hypothetical protein
VQHCHSDLNTSGHTNVLDTPSSDAEWAIFSLGSNIADDPGFTNAAGGLFDLDSDSILREAGLMGSDIGPLQFNGAGGGGGGVANLLQGLIT